MVHFPFEVTPLSLPCPIPRPEYETPTLPFSTDTLNLITSILQDCDEPALYDFIFSEDPVQVTALTNPITVANSVSAFSKERFNAPSPNSTSSVLAKLDGYLLISPALVIGKYTAGVGVKEIRDPTGTSPIRRDHYRFIGNEQSKCYISVRTVRSSEFSRSKGMTILEFFHLHDPLHRTRIFLGLDTKILKEQLTNRGRPSPLIIHKCLKVAQVIKEWRECEICGSLVRPTCNCNPHMPPRRPFDLESSNASMLVHFGAWHGIEALHVAGKGYSFFSGSLGSKLYMNLTYDTNIKNELTQWALHDSVVNAEPTPTQFHLPSQTDEQMIDEEHLIGYFGELVNDDDTAWLNAITTGTEQGKGSSSSNTTGEGETDEINDENTNLSQGNTSSDKERSKNEAGDLIQDAKAEKISTRRQKNRDAAKRSNYNKKLKNEALKKELETQKKLKASLEMTEASLRLKNSELRRLVNQLPP